MGNLELTRIIQKMDGMKTKVYDTLVNVYHQNQENLHKLLDRSASDKSMRTLLNIHDEIERCIGKFGNLM